MCLTSWIDNSTRALYLAPSCRHTSRSRSLERPNRIKKRHREKHNSPLTFSASQWKRNLHLNYHDRLLQDDNSDNPLRRLQLLKQSMWEVATTLQHDTPPQALSTEDKLSWTMIFIRAAESVNIRRMERAAAAYPFITTMINASDPNARTHTNLEITQGT